VQVQIDDITFEDGLDTPAEDIVCQVYMGNHLIAQTGIGQKAVPVILEEDTELRVTIIGNDQELIGTISFESSYFEVQVNAR
jgi:hypothetical protein